MPATLPRILFENESYWLVDKPAGWLSVPGREPKPGDPVVTGWLREIGAAAGVEPFTVHRLDRFTSGIMLYAKTAAAHQQANQWFQDRTVKKIYHFLASPPPSRPAIQVKTPVQGKDAQTLFEQISRHEGPKGFSFFYGKATPLTGRFHQIREHARDAGFPVLGDKSTGGAVFDGVERVCLHAYELTLPFGTFRAELADDLRRLIS
jgi:23S rRNA-/tRNA-specific pseudouridylate synthase